MKIVQDEEGRDWVLVELNRSSIALKGDCDIEVISGECVVRGAMLYSARNGAPGLYHYQRHDESIMDSLKAAIKGTPAVVKLRYTSAPQKYRKPQMSVFLIKPSWQACADALVNRTRLAVMVAGPVSSGKSSFVSYITNRVVCSGSNGYRACAVMDLDLGQPLKNVSGVVSLSLHCEPDLGSDTNVMCHSQALGKTSPKGSEKHYVIAIHRLWKLYRRYCDLYSQQGGLPLIINWHGWYTGMGAQLIDLVSAIVGLTDIVILRRTDTHDEHAQDNVSGHEQWLVFNGLPGASRHSECPHVLLPLLEVIPDLNCRSLPYLLAPSAAVKLPFDSHYIEGFALPLEVEPHGAASGGVTTTGTTLDGVTSVGGPRVRSSLDSVFRRRKRIHRLMCSLFPKRLCLSEMGYNRKSSYFLERLVCGTGSVLSLKNIQFVTGTEFSQHTTVTADSLTASFVGRVIYVTHHADHRDGQDWLVCVGVCTAIDWSQKTISIYTKDPTRLSRDRRYAIKPYPEFSMEEAVEVWSRMKDGLTNQHDARSVKSAKIKRAGKHSATGKHKR